MNLYKRQQKYVKKNDAEIHLPETSVEDWSYLLHLKMIRLKMTWRITYKVALEPNDLLYLGRNTHVLTWYCSTTNTFRKTLGSYLKHFEKSKFCKENIFCKDCFLCGATSHSLLGNKSIDGQVLDREFNCPIAQYQPHQYNLQRGKIIEIYNRYFKEVKI